MAIKWKTAPPVIARILDITQSSELHRWDIALSLHHYRYACFCFDSISLGGTAFRPDNNFMTDTEQLEALRKELAKTWGRQTRWERICMENKATTIQEQIDCAEAALAKPHSGSWAEGMADDWKIRELRLIEAFGGELPVDIGE